MIPAGGDCYAADDGKLQAEPTAVGTYYLVGRNIGPATVLNGLVQLDPCEPIKVVVIAALTCTDGTAAGAADLAALKAEMELATDDLRRLGAALATPALVKVLAA